MRGPALSLAVALQFALPLAAIAQTPAEQATSSPANSVTSQPTAPQPAAPQTPTAQTGTAAQVVSQSRGIGAHVSSVAPEHPLMDGRHFGECVSELAITGECPHMHEE
jgi:hypothetical protein